jgi:hypothetical protein
VISSYTLLTALLIVGFTPAVLLLFAYSVNLIYLLLAALLRAVPLTMRRSLSIRM